MSTPFSTTVRVQWVDTDASGHQHFTAVLRWVEAAENAFYESVGVADELSGHMPRVHVSVDFTARLWFREEVTVELSVLKVGTTSIRYGFRLVGKAGEAARGELVAVLAGDGGGPVPIPRHVRDRLEGSAG